MTLRMVILPKETPLNIPLLEWVTRYYSKALMSPYATHLKERYIDWKEQLYGDSEVAYRSWSHIQPERAAEIDCWETHYIPELDYMEMR